MDKEGASRDDTTTSLHNFSPCIFLVPTEKLETRLWDSWAENTINSGYGSHDNFSEKVEHHEDQSELDPYPTLWVENEGF